jgi:hypothetical protein
MGENTQEGPKGFGETYFEAISALLDEVKAWEWLAGEYDESDYPEELTFVVKPTDEYEEYAFVATLKDPDALPYETRSRDE